MVSLDIIVLNGFGRTRTNGINARWSRADERNDITSRRRGRCRCWWHRRPSYDPKRGWN